MWDYSREEEGCPQLLNLIPRDSKWEEKRVTGEGISEEEKKLELSLALGPPGGGQCSRSRSRTTSPSLPWKVSPNMAEPEPTNQKRTVGWPPICSFRKSISNSKSVPDVGQKGSSPRGLFVKVNMDGIPIGRKLDLRAYDSYDKLCCAVDDLFKDLLAAQADSDERGGLLNGRGEYTLVYEDNEGDRVLVGDVPWHMFVSTAKRLRVLKTSDLPKLSGVAPVSRP